MASQEVPLFGGATMPQARKLRLGDGSVIHLGPAELRSWYERGLINDDTPVQSQGSGTWTRLADVEDMRGWRRSGGPAQAPVRTAPRGSARREFPSAWPRRLALGLGTLLVVAAVAFTSDVWLPALQGLGGRPANGTSKAETGEDAGTRGRREAVVAAVAELPHLRTDTVELVMASSAAGVLDPPEVFRRSYEAAGRGLAALDAADARELGTLNAAMLGALSSRERVQLGDYIERVRGRRPTSPREDAEMSRLVRRGAAALPPARRGRLQSLFAKAVAAALAPAAAPRFPEGAASPEATR